MAVATVPAMSWRALFFFFGGCGFLGSGIGAPLTPENGAVQAIPGACFRVRRTLSYGEMSTLMLQSRDGDTIQCDVDFAFDPMDNDALFDFCRRNGELNIERTAQGEIIVMSPTGLEGGLHDGEVYYQLRVWADRDGRGIASCATLGFLLPDGAMRSPDASWIRRERLEALARELLKKFPPLVPDFVIEVRSASDSLRKLKEKMTEYQKNGVQLGWLIDPGEQRVHVFSADGGVEILDAPEEVAGSGPVEGFVLEMRRIWNPPFGGGEAEA